MNTNLPAKKKLFFTACETSADHHGAELIRELKTLAPDISVEGIGGPEMRTAGMVLHKDMTKISSLGFLDVIRKYPLYKKIFEDTVKNIKQTKPDLLISLDSPAFNLRLAKRVSKIVPIFYYIAPQLWAWGQNRISVVQKHIKKMLVILPFEETFYRSRNVDAVYVGHPLMESLKDFPDKQACKRKLDLTGNLNIGLFSGSRLRELKRIFPAMLEAAKIIQAQIPNALFHANKAPNLPPALYDALAQQAGVKIRFHDASFQDTVRAMDFALVASGTATLETALLGTPFFLLYKTDWTTYFLGRMLVKVKFLGLANLLLDKAVIPEFIQADAEPHKIAALAFDYLKNVEKQELMRKEFSRLREILGEKITSESAAEEILRFLGENDRQ